MAASASQRAVYLNTTITAASASDGAKFPSIIIGYSDGSDTASYNAGASVGSMANTSYRGAVIKSIYKATYLFGVVNVSGNRPANFLTGISYNNAYSDLTYSYFNSGGNYTVYTMSLIPTIGVFNLKLFGS